MGTLAMLHLSKDERAQPVFRKFIETYGSMDVEAEHLQGTGWFTTDPLELQQLLGGHWRTANFRAGDVLIFNMHQPHMSTSNTTRLARISCDTRWQLAADKVGDDFRPLLSPSHSQIILSLFPFLTFQVDPRYVGEAAGHVDAKFGAHAKDAAEATDVCSVTMAQKRREWGL